FFRGLNEVTSSAWTSDARELQHFMGRVRCEGGYTKYARAFAHVRDEHQRQPINAVIVIGDMCEETPQALYDAVSGLGVPCFIFHEGGDRNEDEYRKAAEIFKEMARLNKSSVYLTFNAGAIAQLRELLRAVAVFAVGGVDALADLRTDSARKLLEQMKKR